MPQYHINVFVSATTRDLGSYRKVVTDALLKGGMHPIVQEYFGQDCRTLLEMLHEKIAGCDAVVCLIGDAYGAAPSAEDGVSSSRSYTQIEFDISRELGKPVYLFLASEGCELDQPPTDGDTERELQKQHREAVMHSKYQYVPFSSRDDLRLKITELVPEVRKHGGPPVLSPDLAHAPQAPAFFAGRQYELKQLVESLARSAPCVVAIVGQGGQGKSTLVWRWWEQNGPCGFEAVFWRTAYRGGYTFDQFLDDALGYLLGSKFNKNELPEVSARVNRLLAAIRERKTLIVMDGLERWLKGWNHTGQDASIAYEIIRRQGVYGLDDFLGSATGLASGTHIVLTTRALPAILDDARHAIVPVYDEKKMELGGLDEEAAVTLMQSIGVIGELAAIQEVAHSYQYHPLALNVHARLLVKHFNGRLEHLDRITALDPKDRLFQLLNETREHLPGKPQSERFLQVASHCLENASLPVLAAGLGLGMSPSRNDINRLLSDAVELADWHLLEWDGETETVGLHPLVKQYFSGLATDSVDIHRRLSDWYAHQHIQSDAVTMQSVRTRVLAIEHALRAGELRKCSFLMFSSMTDRFSFIEWLSAWGHLESGSDLLGRLADASEPAQRAEYLIARGALCRHLGRLPQALQSLDEAIIILDNTSAYAGSGHLLCLAGALMNRGNVQREASCYDQALADCNRAVELFGEMAHGNPIYRPHLASAHMNRGNILRDIGHLSRALWDCSQSIELYETLMETMPQVAEPALASALMNRGNILADKRQYADALMDYDRTVAIYDRLLEVGYEELIADRARVQVMRGATMVEYDRGSDALPVLDEAIQAIMTLVDAGRKELEPLLALAWMDRGLACIRLKQWPDASDACDRAVTAFDRFVTGGGGEQEGWLAHSLLNRSEVRYATGDIEGAAQDRIQGLEAIRRVLGKGHKDVLIIFVRKVVAIVDYLLTDMPMESVALVNEVLDAAELVLRGPDATEALRLEVRQALVRWTPLLPKLTAAGFNAVRISRLQSMAV